MIVEFTAPLWLWSGKGAWHFVTLPRDEAAVIRVAVPRRGFGSVRVSACIGETRWSTSIFPDQKSGSYLLPVKAEVRRRQAISPGDGVAVRLSIDL